MYSMNRLVRWNTMITWSSRNNVFYYIILTLHCEGKQVWWRNVDQKCVPNSGVHFDCVLESFQRCISIWTSSMSPTVGWRSTRRWCSSRRQSSRSRLDSGSRSPRTSSASSWSTDRQSWPLVARLLIYTRIGLKTSYRGTTQAPYQYP